MLLILKLYTQTLMFVQSLQLYPRSLTFFTAWPLPIKSAGTYSREGTDSFILAVGNANGCGKSRSDKLKTRKVET